MGYFVANLSLNVPVKEFLESVNIWRSYRQNLWDTAAVQPDISSVHNTHKTHLDWAKNGNQAFDREAE